MEQATNFCFGDLVQDNDTKFKGRIEAIAYYKYGCIQILVRPDKLKKGEQEYPKGTWIDEPALTLVKKSNEKQAKPKHGGMSRSHP